MSYQTTITTKGQITIPKAFRDALGLQKYNRVVVKLAKNGQSIELKPAADFLEVAKKIKTKKLSPLKARDFMEKNYERA